MDLSAEYIDQQNAAIRAKLKYLSAYTTLVQRIKARTDDFVRGNYDSLTE